MTIFYVLIGKKYSNVLWQWHEGQRYFWWSVGDSCGLSQFYVC